MPHPLRHLGEMFRSAATRGRQQREDESVLRDLETGALELPEGLGIEWLGVSGYRLSFEGKDLYLDPYVSRVPLSSLIRRRTALPDPVALDRFLPPRGEAVGVLVGHTHFDHAVDAPAVAARFGCRAYGSDSLMALMALHGLADRAVEVEPYRVYELGPFEVSFVPSVHSKLLLGMAVPYAGDLTCEHLDGLSPNAYKCGQVWGIHIAVAGITLYHQGSADLLDDAIRHRGVDVFLAGVAGRNFTERYWERILPRLDPRVVVPTHYDNFFRPLDASMETIGNARMGELPGEVAAVSRDARLAALPRLADQP
jgi:L-ascorbate metabolism protein UlaG (beta-lactamase superfamily)